MSTPPDITHQNHAIGYCVRSVITLSAYRIYITVMVVFYLVQYKVHKIDHKIPENLFYQTVCTIVEVHHATTSVYLLRGITEA